MAEARSAKRDVGIVLEEVAQGPASTNIGWRNGIVPSSTHECHGPRDPRQRRARWRCLASGPVLRRDPRRLRSHAANVGSLLSGRCHDDRTGPSTAAPEHSSGAIQQGGPVPTPTPAFEEPILEGTVRPTNTNHRCGRGVEVVRQQMCGDRRALRPHGTPRACVIPSQQRLLLEGGRRSDTQRDTVARLQPCCCRRRAEIGMPAPWTHRGTNR